MLYFKRFIRFILDCLAFVFLLIPIMSLFIFMHIVCFPITGTVALYNWSYDEDSSKSYITYYKEIILNDNTKKRK